MSTAVVVGSGPNGLAAAITLAAKGVDVTVLEAANAIGGGARSGEGIVDGLVHDHCAAIHPMAVGSTFLTGLELERHGLRWRWPEIDCAHPLDGGDAGLLYRSVDDTAVGLGADGARWRLAFGGPSASFDTLSQDIMGPRCRSRSIRSRSPGSGHPRLCRHRCSLGYCARRGPGHCSEALRRTPFSRCITR